MSKYIEENQEADGIDRRGFLKCMAWAGTGALCVLQGGVLKSFALSDVMQQQDRRDERRPQLRANQRQPHRIQ